MAIESDRTISSVAQQLGIAAGLLGKWVKQLRERQGAADGISEADLRVEVSRLKQKLAEAKLDNEFLSKATAFFANKQRYHRNARLYTLIVKKAQKYYHAKGNASSWKFPKRVTTTTFSS